MEVDSAENLLKIQLEIPDNNKGSVVKLPMWAPGSYRLTTNWQNIKEVKAKDENGNDMTVVQDGNSWKINPSKAARITYQIATVPNNGAYHWAGPATYLYVEGKEQEPCVLKVVSAANWKAYTGLDEDRHEANVFTAPTYDVLADNPVSIGNVVVDTYRAWGKNHEIVYRGAATEEVDRAKVLQMCRHISEAQGDFFRRSVPYNKYVWHFNVTDTVDGGGGLEHLSSTQITLPSGFGRWSQTCLSHEFFHLWNVKRIRSKVLGPFDYTQLPKTGALWFLEGVTDYYGHLLLSRYGWWGKEEFYTDLASNIQSYTNAQARLTVSIYDSSYKVGEAAGGRGNSQGLGFSYYTAGFFAGAMLDIELRARTKNKYSLDDVTLALWDMTKNDQPGFPEGEIRRQLIRFGGEDMGVYYDNLIMKPGEKDFASTLAKVGLRYVKVSKPFADLTMSALPNRTNGLTVRVPGYRATPPLQSGDVIVEINGTKVGASNRAQTQAAQDMAASAKVGTDVDLVVKRGDQTFPVKISPTFGRRDVWEIQEDPAATPEQNKLREQWLFTKQLDIR